MSKKIKNSPRKLPKQDRSKGLVESILTAATRVFSQTDYDHSTTSLIAKIAGVSVGSLYQYFPNKEALVGALIDRSMDMNVRKFEQKLNELQNEPLDRVIDEMIDTLSEVFLKNRRTMRAIFSHASEVARMESLLATRRRFMRIYRDLMLSRRDEIAVKDLDAAAFVLVNSVMGVVHIAIIDEQIEISVPAVAFELKALVSRYLTTKLQDRVREPKAKALFPNPLHERT